MSGIYSIIIIALRFCDKLTSNPAYQTKIDDTQATRVLAAAERRIREEARATLAIYPVGVCKQWRGIILGRFRHTLETTRL